MRIAQVGTFDLDNLGDLLFPLVFSRILASLGEELGLDIECVQFSPNGCNSGDFYGDQLGALPISSFEDEDRRKKFDLIFIGGGDIVRDDDWSLFEIYGGGSPTITFSWIMSPTTSSEKRLCLLAPGVPFEIDDVFSVYLKNSFSRVRKASSRDQRSQMLLSTCVPDGVPVELVPDIVSALPEFLSLSECFSRSAVVFGASCERVPPYICFQGHASVCPDVVQVGSFLRDLEVRTGFRVVLVEIGHCLGDLGFLTTLSHQFGFSLVARSGGSLCSPTLMDKVAIIAASKGFVGSSLHGNIIANAYGVPHCSYVGGYSFKMRGFFNECETGKLFQDFSDFVKNSEEFTSLVNASDRELVTRSGNRKSDAVLNFVKGCFQSDESCNWAEEFNCKVDYTFRELHARNEKMCFNAIKSNKNTREQIEYRDALVDQLRELLAAEKENARAQIEYRDALLIQLNDRLNSEKDNARAQIEYRDLRLCQLQNQIAERNTRVGIQSKGLVARLKKKLRVK